MKRLISIINIILLLLLFFSCQERKVTEKKIETEVILPLNTMNKELIFYFVTKDKIIDSVELKDILYATEGVEGTGFNYYKIGINPKRYRTIENIGELKLKCLLSKVELFKARHFRGSNFGYHEIVYGFSDKELQSKKFDNVASALNQDLPCCLKDTIKFKPDLKRLSILILHQRDIMYYKLKNSADITDIDTTVMAKLIYSDFEKILKKEKLLK